MCGTIGGGHIHERRAKHMKMARDEIMKRRKMGVILLALLVGGMMIVPLVSAADSPMNAPPMTGIQKIDALLVASAPTLNALTSTVGGGAAHKTFGDYLRGSHGPLTIAWAYPYTGDIRLSMPVGSLSSDEYGLAYAIVDIDNRSIPSEGFVDWHTYW